MVSIHSSVILFISTIIVQEVLCNHTKPICDLPACPLEMCQESGPADTTCQTIAQSVNASDATCCEKHVCAFTIPSTQSRVAVVKSAFLPDGINISDTTPASDSHSIPPTKTEIEACDSNGLIVIEGDLSEVCNLTLNTGPALNYTSSTTSTSSNDSGTSGTTTSASTPKNGTSPNNSSTTCATTTTQAGNTPTQAGNTPTQAGNTPTQAGNTPTQAGNTPTQAGNTPTQAGNTPTQAGNTPTQAGNTPSQNGSTTITDATSTKPTGSGSTTTSEQGSTQSSTPGSSTTLPNGQPSNTSSTSTAPGNNPRSGNNENPGPLDKEDETKLCALSQCGLCTTVGPADDSCKTIATTLNATDAECRTVKSCVMTYKGRVITVTNSTLEHDSENVCDSNGLSAFCGTDPSS